jgi:hypothetical protein
LLGSEFQRWTLPFLWVPELFQASAISFWQRRLITTDPKPLSNSLIIQLLTHFEVKVMLRPTTNRLVCLDIRHTSGAHDNILLTQIWDSSNLEGQVPEFLSPKEQGVPAICSDIGFHYLLLLTISRQGQRIKQGSFVPVYGRFIVIYSQPLPSSGSICHSIIQSCKFNASCIELSTTLLIPYCLIYIYIYIYIYILRNIWAAWSHNVVHKMCVYMVTILWWQIIITLRFKSYTYFRIATLLY